MKDVPGRWIRTGDELEALVAHLDGVRAIGIDTEGDSLHHYAERVCLIQLSAHGGGAWLIDPLALDDLSALQPVMADGSVLKVFHGGDNDVTSLKRDFGFTLQRLFDTAVAARLLGDRELGLQALVKNELGVELDKGSQRDDWSKRPLTAAQEAYALADVEHLMALAARLTARLQAAGRTAWAREEFEAMAALEAIDNGRREPDGYRKIKGAGKLNRRQQAVLRELHVWREARAQAADKPPFRIVDADVLIGLAEHPPDSAAGVARVLRRYSRLGGETQAVFDAIQRGRDLSDDQLPDKPRGERRRSTPGEDQRIEALRAWRDEEAVRSGLDPSVVLSTRLIERLAAAAPASFDELDRIEGLRQWRIEAWGEALLDACDVG